MPWLEVDKEREGQRLDNFILSQVKGVPKSLIYRLVRKGSIRVSGKRKQVSYKLVAGERVWVPDFRQSAQKKIEGDFDWLLEKIVYEDDAMLIINKPSGLPSHSGSGYRVGLIEALRVAKKDVHYLDLAHRIDKNTSGLIMLAKKRSALKQLQTSMMEGKIEKYYWAVMTGVWQKDTQWVDLALKRVTGATDKVVVAKDGKPALTYFKKINETAQLTLVEAKLETGRMHQVRAHAKAWGHPLLMDDRYNTPASREVDAMCDAKRLGLHARRLVLPHPVTGEILDIHSEFPEELAKYFEGL